MTPIVTMSVNRLSEFDLVAASLAEAGLATPRPLVEILWDNYCCTDPHELADDLARFAPRVALHVMWSRFLERDLAELDGILARLRGFVDVLRPEAVSDHLCRFAVAGVRVPFAQEHGYDDLDGVCARVGRYQDRLGMQLLLENAASTHEPAARQIDFLARVQARTGCGVLFDVSNAVVGAENGLGGVDAWLDFLAGRTLRCHVGGYGVHAASGTVQDTHGHDVSDASEDALRRTAAAVRIESLTYERDYQKSVAACAADLRRIRTCVNA